ncbi:hypothetical protein CYL31_12065 [Marinomonas sp. A3A]|uniref:hypothetical protein n=1 Tax=Marinomonas sp. A3A TaxID=2065312 RepID=UPI001BB3D795|nr:hypothetical protein [Marinomonas sp. A3A]QUX92098.1 hypothetical protein CYL31_12065 [Marinomonas sp. A3A]
MKYSKPLFALSGVALFLSGCASQVVDNTPIVDTSVLQYNTRIGGYMMPDANVKEVRYTVADKSTTEVQTEYDSWVVDAIAIEKHVADIARFDKNLLWSVNYETEEFAECGLSGCTGSLSPLEKLREEQKEGKAQDDGGEEGYNPNGTESCEVKVKKYDFHVTPEARQREINGFVADQYVAKWELVSEDDQGNLDQHVVTMDFWMANVSSNQALQVAHNFDRKYYNEVIASAPLDAFLDHNAATAMEFLSAGKPEEMKKLTSVDGEPISVKIEWYVDANTCPTPKSEEESTKFDVKDPVNSLKSMAGDFLSNTAEKGAKTWMGMEDGKPALTIIREVKAAKMTGEHTSRFEVPKGFKLIDRK